MYIVRFITCISKLYDNNGITAGRWEMEACYYKSLILYLKWYNTICRLFQVQDI